MSNVRTSVTILNKLSVFIFNVNLHLFQNQNVEISYLGTSHDGIDVTAWSPTGRSLPCPVKEKDGVHTATFQPDETGEWSIAITHKGNHIQGGPFTCFVFDPNGIKV